MSFSVDVLANIAIELLIKKPLRPSQRVMTPVNTSALRLTISSTAPAPYPGLLGVI